MKIKGLEGITVAELFSEVEKGAKFVVFQYCISILVLTFKRSSPIYLIKSGESTFKKSMAYSLLSFFFGWWGIPWGPIYTIGSLVNNFKGGKDVTNEIMSSLNKGTLEK